MTSARLAAVICTSDSVHITKVGEYDPRDRSRTQCLFTTHDPQSLRSLQQALRVSDASFAEQIAVMTLGDLDLNFLRGHELIATVSYIHPNLLRWGGWSSDARLIDPDGLCSRLTELGWTPPAR